MLSAPRTRSCCPLIDLSSYGSLPAYGVGELANAESRLFVTAVASYGYAPMVIVLAGYERFRSIGVNLAGERVGAECLELPALENEMCGCAGRFDERNAAPAVGCGSGTVVAQDASRPVPATA